MNLHQEQGEFVIELTRFSIETEGDSIYIYWRGRFFNLKNTFPEMIQNVEADGHIFVSNNVNERYGNFVLLPHTHNSRFYENGKLKANTIGICCFDRKTISIDAVVTMERFAFLLDTFKIFSARADNKIWIKTKLWLENQEQINDRYIAPTRDVFFSNIGSGSNCFYAFNEKLDFAFNCSFNPSNT